jgi:uncharacterized protein (DUF2236 family)
VRFPRPTHLVRKVRHDLAQAEDWGFFGPDSAMWRIHQEGVLGLGLGHALLLQLAHPFVAQAVSDHSRFPEEAERRLAATWTSATYLIFGSRAQAEATAARIRRVHATIHGRLTEDVGRWSAGQWYSAEDGEALLWVLVTLVQTSLEIYQRFIRPLTADQKAAYAADAERLGNLLEVPKGRLPGRLEDLRQLIGDRIADGTVQVSRAALRLAGACLDPPTSDVPQVLRRTYRSLQRSVCHALLPSELRRQYQPVLGTGRTPRDRLLECLTRATVWRLPAGLRCDPLARTALKRWQAA